MCQVKRAAEAQLKPNLSRSRRLTLLLTPARIIAYHQGRNRQARRSHRKTALRKLRARGILISKLPKCNVRL